LYPITNEFFELVKKTYFLLFLVFVDVLGIFSSTAIRISLIGTISTICFIPIFLCLHTATQVIQLLISLVAIRKFLMHFFPSLIPKILNAQKILINKIWILYLLLFINDIVGYAYHIISSRNIYISVSILRVSILSIFQYLLISMNGVLLISSLLYFPVLISLWCKKKEVEARKKNKPQTLIIWQTVIILVFKVTSITMIILFLNDSTAFFTVAAIIIIDIISTPLIVQISYFINNRKSVKFMIWNFSLANFIKVVLNWETRSAVEPERTNLEM
ncbi:LOW QUALITY PROTEIN: Protein CBR-SRZ-24, partial [Caenorhabditis briggsae]